MGYLQKEPDGSLLYNVVNQLDPDAEGLLSFYCPINAFLWPHVHAVSAGTCLRCQISGKKCKLLLVCLQKRRLTRSTWVLCPISCCLVWQLWVLKMTGGTKVCQQVHSFGSICNWSFSILSSKNGKKKTMFLDLRMFFSSLKWHFSAVPTTFRAFRTTQFFQTCCLMKWTCSTQHMEMTQGYSVLSGGRTLLWKV